jgi:tRNA(Leu) C34 or U34 (ribose-2'-O)-methylase TrmL
VAITPAAIKSSAGAWVHLRIARCCKGTSAIEDLKQAGYWIAALAPEGAITVYDFDTTRRPVRVVGSEGRGVREIVKKGTDFVMRIPMRGRIGSLNVSVVAALALFEIARRRGVTAATPAAGTTVGADAGGGRTGITDAGARPLRPGTATAPDRRDVGPPRRRTADGVCGARRECASLRQESVTSRNGVLHRRRT